MLPAVCARMLSACSAVALGVVAIAGPAGARHADPAGSVSEITIPGGLGAALAIIDDRAAPDRGHFLLDFTRRFYDTPLVPKSDRREPLIKALAAQVDPAVVRPAQAGAIETLPLPLAPRIWTDVVFGGSVQAEGLVGAIVQSRNAALLYHGLMALDADTRNWLARRPDLLGELATRHAASFTAAAPGLRVGDGVVRVPGGEHAAPAWEALVGRRVDEPVEFVRSLLVHSEGRLSVFFGAFARLTPPQARIAFQLDSTDPGGRVNAARRLYAVFESLVPDWRIEERTFWRPGVDPLTLLAELPADREGRPVLPGARAFWSAVFADPDYTRRKARSDQDARALAGGAPVDFPWLCEQVFGPEHNEQRRRYQLVMFGSRLLSHGITAATSRDAVDAVRAAAAYPALVAVLEQASVADVAAYAAAANAAARLSRIDDTSRILRATAQFQGALSLFARAAVRGSITADAFTGIVTSLSAIDLGEDGQYEGRLVRWLAAQLTADLAWADGDADISEALGAAPGALEREAIRLLAGAVPAAPRLIDWEGMRYRVDPAWAEATRIGRLLGEHSRPYVSTASAIVGVSDRLAARELTRGDLGRQLEVLEQLGRAIGWGDTEPPDDSAAAKRYREAAAALQRAAAGGDARAAARLSPALRTLADDLLALGLLELAYAAAMGQPDRAIISAAEAAVRHDFGLDAGSVRRTAAAWRLPRAGATMHGWRVTGSLLGLDVRLAEFSLLRVSSRPPPRKPTLNDEDRRVLVETVAVMQPLALEPEEHETIVTAIRKGRARLAAMRTDADAQAIADAIRLAPARRTVLSWLLTHDPGRTAAFLSPGELFWLGLDGTPLDGRLDAWGVLAEPRRGCLCLQMPDRRPWEDLAGRWNAGVLASMFPDLNLRVAELLAGLRMPAALLPPVLAAATLELINHATSRDPDDRRGLVEFVQALGAERLEQYLALLTTDGPLVPVPDTSAVSPAGPARSGAGHTEVPR